MPFRRWLAAALLGGVFCVWTSWAAASEGSGMPIALNKQNPHYFVFRGKTIALVTSGEHYGSVLNGAFDYATYLKTLADGKLNYTRIFGGIYIEVPSKSFGILRNNLAPEPAQFVAPWVRDQASGKFDLDRWNAKYFERFQAFLGEASRRGIVVEVSLFTSFYDEKQWAISPLNPNNNVNHLQAIPWKNVQTLENGKMLHYQEQYVRKLVSEAKKFDNVIFEIQNEPWSDHPVRISVVNPYLAQPQRDKYPNSVEVPDPQSLAWQTRVAEWIQSEEASLTSKHLIAQNYSNFVAPVKEVIPGVSILNFHYAYPQAVSLNYGLDKAIGYDESGFLGREDAVYLRQAWNFMLAGGSTFNNLDYSFSAGHEDGRDLAANGPGGGSPTLRRQLKTLADFLNALPLERLKPMEQAIKHSGGAIAHGLADDGHVYAIYLDGKGPDQLTLILPQGAYRGEWLRPETGETFDRQSFKHAGGERVIKTPAFDGGVAFRLEKTK
jgi:hypothetical protein